MGSYPDVTDHLILGTPDVAQTVRRLATEWGVIPQMGGQHLGQGTRNALLSLGPRVYLEILGPDPDQPAPPHPRWLGIDQLTEDRLITWAARATDLTEFVARAAAAGVDLGEVTTGNRLRADGRRLEWLLTDVTRDRSGGVVPFFLDWGDSPHPAESAPTGAELISLSGRHPDPEAVSSQLEALGLELDLQRSPAPGLKAVVATPAGIIELS